MATDRTKELLKALEAGGYDATPSELLQGCHYDIVDLDEIFSKPLYTPPKCECGAHKIGIKAFKPGHSTWCPQSSVK